MTVHSPLAVPILVAAVCVSVGTADVVVEVVSPDRFSWEPADQPHHCFGGDSATLKLRIFGSAGDRIDLAGQLFQITNRLAVPVGEAFNISAGAVFDNTARLSVTTEVKLPRVERRAVFELRFLARRGTTDTQRVIGRHRIVGYPPGLLGELGKLAEQQPFKLQDPEGRLAAVFDEHEIAYVSVDQADLSRMKLRDRGGSGKRMRPRHAGLVLCVIPSNDGNDMDGEETDNITDALLHKGFRVIRFREVARTLPSVVFHRFGDQVRVDVELPLLEVLGANPRAQALLVEIVRRTLAESRP